MSSRRLAMLGSRSGAWISIQGMRNPHLRITNSKGARVLVQLVQADQSAEEKHFAGDGVYALPEADFARVSSGEGNTKMICDIISRREEG